MKLAGALRSGDMATVSTTLFVLLSCNLVFLLTNLKPPQHAVAVEAPPEETERRMGFEPISFIASKLSVMVMAYLSAVVYLGKHPTFEELSARMHRTWRRPAVTLLYIELFATAPASLLLALASFARAVEGSLQETLMVSGSVALLSYLGPALFPFSDIAYKMGLLASIVEEDCEGIKALKRAEELAYGMKLRGLGLIMVITVAEQALFMVLGCDIGGDWTVGTLLLAVPAHLIMKFFAYLAYTVFYYECKKRNGRDQGGKRKDAIFLFSRPPHSTGT